MRAESSRKDSLVRYARKKFHYGAQLAPGHIFADSFAKREKIPLIFMHARRRDLFDRFVGRLCEIAYARCKQDSTEQYVRLHFIRIKFPYCKEKLREIFRGYFAC